VCILIFEFNEKNKDHIQWHLKHKAYCTTANTNLNASGTKHVNTYKHKKDKKATEGQT
jgi:hypothetical protein